MNFDDFKQSVEQENQPPEDLPETLKALWFDRRGDWKRAHEVAQEVHNPQGSLVHAYLHRKEGDLGNARYWYSRAGRSEHQGSLDQEWEEITRELIADAQSGG